MPNGVQEPESEEPTMKRRLEWPALIAVSALLIISPIVLYVGAYYALVRPGAINLRSMRAHISPCYPQCAAIGCDWLFGPMHEIDRRLRPSYWVRPPNLALFLALTADDVADSPPEPTP